MSLFSIASSKAITYCFFSIVVLFILGFTFLNRFFYIIKIHKNYNKKVMENAKSNKNSFDSDDYVYDNNGDIYKENVNINQKIIKKLKKANEDQNKKLENVVKLKKELNIDNNINSRIDNTVLSKDNDNLQYTKQQGNFFSRLLFS